MMLKAERARFKFPCVASPFFRTDATNAQASRSSSHVFVSTAVNQLNEVVAALFIFCCAVVGVWSLCCIAHLIEYGHFVILSSYKVILKTPFPIRVLI